MRTKQAKEKRKEQINILQLAQDLENNIKKQENYLQTFEKITI